MSSKSKDVLLPPELAELQALETGKPARESMHGTLRPSLGAPLGCRQVYLF